jgi:hypothetical protein
MWNAPIIADDLDCLCLLVPAGYFRFGKWLGKYLQRQ